MKVIEKSKDKASTTEWNLADAKNKFSEVFNLALHHKPQIISRRGEKVVIISKQGYEKLRGVKHSFLDALFQGPGLDGVDLTRDKSVMRKATL
ncbi:MAG: type II toxin-antitoxin system Phd/YefM family antitoxin [Candidatus Omnitrophota bacterium]